MGFARFVSVPCPVISSLSIAPVNVAAQQEPSGTVLNDTGSALPGATVTLVTSTPLFSSPLELAFGVQELHSDCWALDVHVGAANRASR